MHTYCAYDLKIRSELPLPELEAADATPDVTITFGKVSPVPAKLDSAGSGLWVTAEEACYFFENVGAFLVRNGREITVDPASDVEPGRLRLSILGPVLGILLHQRGRLVLHASCVAIDGGGVTFAGGRGFGKSTLAAALYARGHGVVADDVTAIDDAGDRPRVVPGFPQVKLWPDAVSSLGDSRDIMPPFHPLLDKRGFRVARGFPPEAVPLRRIYILSDAAASGVECLRPGEAVVELVRHWYGGRFGAQLLNFGNAATVHLQKFSRLATSVPVRRLTRAGRPSSMLDQIALVEADLAS